MQDTPLSQIANFQLKKTETRENFTSYTLYESEDSKTTLTLDLSTTSFNVELIVHFKYEGEDSMPVNTLDIKKLSEVLTILKTGITNAKSALESDEFSQLKIDVPLSLVNLTETPFLQTLLDEADLRYLNIQLRGSANYEDKKNLLSEFFDRVLETIVRQMKRIEEIHEHRSNRTNIIN